ncbi:MAG: type II secretion system protein [Patescibacteria group bacterium]
MSILRTQKKHSFGFTLLELLIAIGIISILTTIMLTKLQAVREAATLVRAKKELRVMVDALNIYLNDNAQYPVDVSRDIPPGLEKYLGPGIWPDAPWLGSVYDWENWVPSDIAQNPKEQVYQISIRFCPIGGPLSACHFPPEPWAANFNVNSSMYYCIQGPCRSHVSEALNYPGYCVNC